MTSMNPYSWTRFPFTPVGSSSHLSSRWSTRFVVCHTHPPLSSIRGDFMIPPRRTRYSSCRNPITRSSAARIGSFAAVRYFPTSPNSSSFIAARLGTSSGD